MRNFEVKEISALIPMMRFPRESESSMIIHASGIFDGETQPTLIRASMTDLAVNSLPFTALLSFIFGNKGRDNATQFISPDKLVFTVETDSSNPGKYVLNSFTLES